MTIRGIRPELRAALEKRAREQNKSLNQVVLDDLMRAEGLGDNGGQPKRDLSFMWEAGPLEPEVDRALEEMRVVNPDEWKDEPS